jgi:hypothetical protein
VVADDVRRHAAPYMRLDPHCASSESRSQLNSSLYLDTPGFAFYRHHIEASPDRFKLRVRFYGDPPRGMAFFEIKRKVKSVIAKDRAAVPFEQMAAMIEGNYDTLPTSAGDRAALESFLYLQTVYGARPRLLVCCLREAYSSPDPLEELRLTFDRKVYAQEVYTPTVTGDPGAWVPIDGELQHGRKGAQVLVELKFSGIAPLWMRQLVDKLDMWREGYSKFCAGVSTVLEQANADDALWDAGPRGDF